MATERREDLLAELRRLGPWHHDIQITADLNTRDWVEDRGPGSADATLGRGMLEDCRSGASLELGRCMFSPARTLEQGLLRYFPEGIGDRSVLDCACNAGGYLFAAKDAGAGRCLGFDVRQHWIDQAEFVRTHREAPSDDMRFAVCNLYELSTLDLEPYDVTLFNGILYHLPDPVGGLRIAADLTREVMVVNTHTKAGCPDGLMHVGPEGVDHPLSGVYGLKFAPTGPAALEVILRWAGFVDVRVAWWRQDEGDGWGRMELIASKVPGLLPATLDDGVTEESSGMG